MCLSIVTFLRFDDSCFPFVPSSDQITIPQPLPIHVARHGFHLVDGVDDSIIVATGKFADISVQVLLTHIVVGAVVAVFEHGPEAFNPVGVRLTPNILTNAVFHSLILKGHAVIAAVIIRVDRRAIGHPFSNEAL